MSYQHYRNSTLGRALQESLDEMIENRKITPELAAKVLLQFDKSINDALPTKTDTRLNFQANKLETYRLCDTVWTLLLSDVNFRGLEEIGTIDKLKIVACEAKTDSSGQHRAGAGFLWDLRFPPPSHSTGALSSSHVSPVPHIVKAGITGYCSVLNVS